MLTGFNTNIRHRGVLFHVQSEDSGRDHPHVITHLFHGGNIMASEKSSYADQVDAKDLEGVVRTIMERQHKAVLKGLRAGKFDDVILERVGPAVFHEDEEPSSTESATGLSAPAAPAPEPAAEATAKPAVDPARTLDPVEEEVVQGELIEPDPAPPQAPPAPDAGRPFGDAIVSDKPLDEVILDYLVQNARKRKKPSA